MTGKTWQYPGINLSWPTGLSTRATGTRTTGAKGRISQPSWAYLPNPSGVGNSLDAVGCNPKVPDPYSGGDAW